MQVKQSTCIYAQSKQLTTNVLHPRVISWSLVEVRCSALYSSTLERMPGKTLVSGETFIGAQSIASFSRSPPLKYPCTCPLQFSSNHSLVKIIPTIIRTTNKLSGALYMQGQKNYPTISSENICSQFSELHSTRPQNFIDILPAACLN